MTDMTKLGQLVFYAIDKASPRNLALEPNTNLAAIEDTDLRELGITDHGRRIMWAIINVGGPEYAGSSPVAAAAQEDCQTAGQVWKAVCAASNAVTTQGEFL
jgi:hypothetical protein